MITFEEYIDQGIMRKGRIDLERARSLIVSSENKIKSLQEKIEKIGVRNDNANDYVEYSYDTLMLIIRAMLFSKGYSASGQGSHEAEIAYLATIGIEDGQVRFIDTLRYYRNGILYYGTHLDAEYANKVIAFTKKMYKHLRDLIKI